MHFLNMFFFDIYPYIAGTVFLVEAGCVTTTASTPGVRPPARCWIVKGCMWALTCSTSVFWDFCRSLPGDADAALDV